MSNTIDCIDDQEIVDWYDGIVRALVHSRDDRSWLYCFLLSFNIPKNERTFAYLSMPDPLGTDILAWLRSRSGKRFPWKAFLKLETSILQSSENPVRIARVLDQAFTEAVWASCSIDLIRPFYGQGIEGAIAEPSVRFWSSFWTDLEGH